VTVPLARILDIAGPSIRTRDGMAEDAISNPDARERRDRRRRLHFYSSLLFSSSLSRSRLSRGNGSVVEDATYSPCRVPPAVAFVASRTSTASRSLGSCLAVRPSGKIRQTRLNVPVISRPRVAKVAMRKINVGRRSRRMGYAATRRRRGGGTAAAAAAVAAAAIGPFRTAFEKLSPRPSAQSGLSGPRGLLPSPCLCRWDERETRRALCLAASARS